jgi:DinB superfamily
LPCDRDTVLRELSQADRDAQDLVRGLSDAQLNWQPNGGKAWSVAQCLDHLTKANTVYTTAMRTAVSNRKPDVHAAESIIRPGWFESYFIKILDAPPKRRLKSPKKIVPSAKLNGGEVLRAFLSSQEAIRAVIRDSKHIDLNRVRFKNPFVSIFRFSVGAGLLILAAHDRRHLWQAQQTRSALAAREFPPGI